MLIRAVAEGWQHRTVMNIQLEKAFNEIKKSKTGKGLKGMVVEELCTPRTVEYIENSPVRQKNSNLVTYANWKHQPEHPATKRHHRACGQQEAL
jgi:hypothetical protein